MLEAARRPARGRRLGLSPARRGHTAAPLRALLALAALLALSGLGCQGQAQTGPQQVRGLVVNVQARSIAETEAITLRTEDGRELILRVDRAVEMTPGHLREHMALGQPVLVTYQQTPDGLLATRIDDA